jgi:hypothetical protein
MQHKSAPVLDRWGICLIVPHTVWTSLEDVHKNILKSAKTKESAMKCTNYQSQIHGHGKGIVS